MASEGLRLFTGIKLPILALRRLVPSLLANSFFLGLDVVRKNKAQARSSADEILTGLQRSELIIAEGALGWSRSV